MPSLQALPQSRSSTLNSTAGYGTGQGVRRSSSPSNHKAVPTCTVSLAHVEAVVSPTSDAEFATITTSNERDSTPAVPIPMPIPVPSSASKTPERATDIKAPRSRFNSTSSAYRPNEVNVIPFPTTTTFSSMSASRPLPIPPRPHALLRASAVINATAPTPPTHMVTGEEDLPRRIRVRKGSLVSTPAPALRKSPLGVGAGAPRRPEGLVVPSPQAMERRRSRDPNVADHLVVEVDDADEEVVTARMGGRVVVEDEEDIHKIAVKVEEVKGMLEMAMEKVSEVLQDVVGIPKRPSSPTPDTLVSSRAAGSTSPTPSTTPTSPELAAPPAYSSLPPPYSASDYEDLKGVEGKVEVEVPLVEVPSPVVVQLVPQREERQPAPIVVPVPVRTHKLSVSSPSASSSSSAGPSGSKRSRISTSELKVLVYLYRTVVYGLEMRRRREEREEREAKMSRSSSRAPSPMLLEKARETATPPIARAKKPLGPRASAVPSSPYLKSTLPPPESKSQLESALFSATTTPRAQPASPKMLIKGKEKAQESSRGFGAFPLVEDDEDVVAVFDEDLEDMEEDYVVPRTPLPTPSQSPRSTPPPLAAASSAVSSNAPSASSSRTTTPTPGQTRPCGKKLKSKAELNAELDVQDALLAIRLREFLRAQGVCEGDLRVEVEDEVADETVHHENVKEVAPTMELLQEEEEVQAEPEENGGNILDEYFMGIEEEDTSDDETSTKTKPRGVLIEEEDSTPPSKAVIPAIPAPIITTISSCPHVTHSAPRTMSPPPASPSPRPRAVLPTSYMVALLTMRMRHPSRRPSSSSSSSGSDKGGKGRAKATNDSEFANGGKRKSGLSVIVEVD